MSEPRISNARLAAIHDERPHLVIQDDEFQRLAMDLTDARARLEAVTQERDFWRDSNNVQSNARDFAVSEYDRLAADVKKLRGEVEHYTRHPTAGWVCCVPGEGRPHRPNCELGKLLAETAGEPQGGGR